jgi:hypothetical protein
MGLRPRVGLAGIAMELLTQLFGELLTLVYHCFDRIVIYGYLSGLSRPEQVVHFFRQIVGVPAVDKEILSQRTADYQAWVEAFAGNHRLPIEWAEKGVRKEDHVLPWQRRMAKADAYGVYFIFKSMEQGATFRVTVPKYPTKDPNYRILAHQRSRFTHYYFYIRDAVLGPMACPARRDDTDESGVAAALASFRATFEATQKGCAITGDYDDASRCASHGKKFISFHCGRNPVRAAPNSSLRSARLRRSKARAESGRNGSFSAPCKVSPPTIPASSLTNPTSMFGSERFTLPDSIPSATSATLPATPFPKAVAKLGSQGIGRLSDALVSRFDVLRCMEVPATCLRRFEGWR